MPTQKLKEALSIVPTPGAATSRELVQQAIEMKGPARIPYSFVQPLQSDFFELAEVKRQFEPKSQLPLGQTYTDAWQVTHEVSNGLFDRVIDSPLKDLSTLPDYKLPTLNELVDLDSILPLAREAHAAGKHVVAADPVLLFEQLRSLLGFQNMLLAPHKEKSGFQELLQRLTQRTLESIELFGSVAEIDSFMTWQDFGTQTGLMISLEEFRELYKPGLARAVEAAHKNGLYFILHSCGQIQELIGEFIEIGVDVLQMDQARLIGHEVLRKEFGGQICFWNTVDTLWSSQTQPTEEQLRVEVRDMVKAFADLPGGFMARHYPQPEDVELPPFFHEVSRKAFLEVP